MRKPNTSLRGYEAPSISIALHESQLADWYLLTGVGLKSRIFNSKKFASQHYGFTRTGTMKRYTVDLSQYPELVVIYLGMRVNMFRGVKTLLGFGPKIAAVGKEKPDGLLAHENIVYSIFPLHIGMRQYWRDFESLEKWARSEPHRKWWRDFLKDSKGTGFWHETYLKSGGMEAVYVDVPDRFGLRAFAPEVEARGSMFSARQRSGRTSEPGPAPVVAEDEFYQ